MDTETAKQLLQSRDVHYLREQAEVLAKMEEDAMLESKVMHVQLLKFQILVYNRILKLQRMDNSSSCTTSMNGSVHGGDTVASQEIIPVSPDLALDQAATLQQMAAVWIRMGEYDRAVGQLRKAVQLLDISNVPTRKTTVAIQQMLADAYTNCSMYQPAIEQQKSAIDKLESLKSDNTLSIVDDEVDGQNNKVTDSEIALAYAQLACIYELNGDFDAAKETLFDKSAPLAVADDAATATVVSQIGKLHEKLGEYSEAATAFERALELLVLLYGEHDERSEEISYLLGMARDLLDE